MSIHLCIHVTPCVGVWIETEATQTYNLKCLGVTPCVGVWIETLDGLGDYSERMSHPAWVCGLKRTLVNEAINEGYVTPCVGVWIETSHTLCLF